MNREYTDKVPPIFHDFTSINSYHRILTHEDKYIASIHGHNDYGDSWYYLVMGQYGFVDREPAQEFLDNNWDKDGKTRWEAYTKYRDSKGWVTAPWVEGYV